MGVRRPASLPLWAALAWGFAEATFFFVVPDVLLTFLGLRNLRRGLAACLAALLGALVGGSVMYAWGARDAGSGLAMLDRVPAVSPAMIERVRVELEEGGLPAIILGPTRGTPYKLYALRAGEAGVGWLPFLLVSVPARLLRFVSLTLLAAAVGKIARGRLATPRLEQVLLLSWALFYLVYWTLMPG